MKKLLFLFLFAACNPCGEYKAIVLEKYSELSSHDGTRGVSSKGQAIGLEREDIKYSMLVVFEGGKQETITVDREIFLYYALFDTVTVSKSGLSVTANER